MLLYLINVQSAVSNRGIELITINPAYIAILNDSTRYQAEPGNAEPEALPRLSPARQSLGTLIPRLRAWEPVIETDLGLLYFSDWLG
jgi:hypothetical protein